jgi:hypothetical protein
MKKRQQLAGANMSMASIYFPSFQFIFECIVIVGNTISELRIQ